MDYEIFVTPGLGDNSYLLISDGDAVLVDPQRDVWRFLDHVYSRELNLVGVLETHVHNDYVSGALEIRDNLGAELYLPAKGDYEFEHKPVSEGFKLQLGQKYEIEVLDTPGHTYEHISWVVKEQGIALGVFTGGSLIVGSAGRTDLLGENHTPALTRLQYETMQKLQQLPDDTRVLPTHGAGSFCTSSNPSDSRTSTIEVEKKYNQAVTASDLDEFMQRQLSGLLEYPTYYKYMASINRKGPKVYGQVPVPEAMDIHAFQEQIQQGAYVVDLRDRLDFANCHITGSYNFEVKSSMANYLGWIIPFNANLVLVANNISDIEEATTQLFRIGYDSVVGYLDGGIKNWKDAGLPLKSYHPISHADLVSRIVTENDFHVVDVRQPTEYQDFHLRDSTNIFLPRTLGLGASLPSKNVGVLCVSGQRAAIAASILEQQGYRVMPVYDGGIVEVFKKIRPDYRIQ